MSYQQYGISQELVERVKGKMKNPVVKEKVKKIVEGVTKADLQNHTKVRKLLDQVSQVVGISVSGSQAERIIDFVIANKIDPKNKFHLIKLWSMFR